MDAEKEKAISEVEALQAELAQAVANATGWEAKVRELKEQLNGRVQQNAQAGIKPRRCCNDEANLFVDEGPRQIHGMMGDKPITATVTVQKCRVCDARHHTTVAEPGHFNVTGKNASS